MKSNRTRTAIGTVSHLLGQHSCSISCCSYKFDTKRNSYNIRKVKRASASDHLGFATVCLNVRSSFLDLALGWLLSQKFSYTSIPMASFPMYRSNYRTKDQTALHHSLNMSLSLYSSTHSSTNKTISVELVLHYEVTQSRAVLQTHTIVLSHTLQHVKWSYESSSD